MSKSKIVLNRRDFIACLKRGSVFCGKNRALPILENVRCMTRGDRIRVESTDSDNAIRLYGKLAESCETDCSFCVCARDLLSILSLISDETVIIEVDTEETKDITIRHAKGKSVLPYISVDEFPAPPVVGDNVRKITLPTGVLSRWLSVAADFVANDILRPQMSGILLYGEGDKIGVAATDSHKLFCTEREFESGDGSDFRIVLNVAAARALMGSLSSLDGEIEITIGDGVAILSSPTSVVTSRLVEGRYPNVKSVIPRDCPYTLTFDRMEMLQGVRRLLPSASTLTELVRISTDGVFIKAASEDLDFRKSAEETMSFSGDAIEPIGLKGSTFVHVLSSFDDDNVVMGIKNPSCAILISRTDNDGSADNFIVMPMLLS